MADETPLAHRIGINGVALAMVVQATLVLVVTLAFIGLYAAVGTLAVFTDPTVEAEVRPFILGGGAVALGCTVFTVFAFTLPYWVTAWGLRARKPWSHLAGLILSGLSLSNFPFGLVAGVMGFVVLLDKDLSAELKRGGVADVEGSS